jgi:antitoxin (DNA-binding transcriptional repressor) of toxin-antitoxin stability system
MSRIIKASEFKAKCLALFDEVERTGDVLVVTKRGKAIAEVRPHRPEVKRGPFGIWKGQTEILGDIISPIDVEWDALK